MGRSTKAPTIYGVFGKANLWARTTKSKQEEGGEEGGGKGRRNVTRAKRMKEGEEEGQLEAKSKM
jgi:hypothetical protein